MSEGEKSEMPGTATSKPEVTNIEKQGFWILLDGRELFLDYEDFPWFLDATIAQILDLERPHAGHLRWPRLDIDLSVESIEHPGRFPLKSRRGPAPE